MIIEISKHQKAIQILEAIDRLDYRIESNGYLVMEVPVYSKRHYSNRVIVDNNIKQRLINSYNKINFKL